MILGNPETVLVAIDAGVGERAAALRARYNLSLADAMQIAAALAGDCDAFLSNNTGLLRVQELNMVILDDMLREAGAA